MLEEAFNTDQLVQGIEGKVIAELFDAETGELVQREETHNFISQPALDFLKKAQRFQFSRGIEVLNNTLNQDLFQIDKSDAQLVLTDNSNAENAAAETHMYGQLIGWSARTTYSGADTYRGSPNGALCSANNSQVQWVFDWPTHAANGTINSIGWVKFQHADTSTTSPAYASYGKATAQFTSPQTWLFFTRASTSQSFGNTGNTTIYVLDGNYAQTSTFSVSAQFTAVRGIAWDNSNSKLWVIGTSSGVARIASYNSSGTLVDALVTVTNRTYTAMAFDGTGLWTTTQSGTTATIYKLNTSSGADTSSFSFTTNQTTGNVPSVICGIAYEPTKQALWIRERTDHNSSTAFASNEPGYSGANNRNWLSRLLCFNTSGQQIAMQLSLWIISQPYGTLQNNSGNSYQVANSAEAPYFNSYVPTSTIGTVGYYIIDGASRNNGSQDVDVIDPYTFIIPTSSGKVSHVTTDGLGSRALLGSPITKTNSQTLRITYQVNFT